MKEFEAMVAELGVPIAQEKTEGLVMALSFLGIHIDSVQQSCSLPIDKLATLRCLISTALGAWEVTIRQLQELVGHLNFVCRVVAPGRAFLQQLCEAMKGASRHLHRIRVSTDVWADLEVWLEFLEQYNGASF